MKLIVCTQKKVLLFLLIIQILAVSCEKPKELKFVFLTDIHVVPGNAQEQAFRDVVAEINKDNYDFVVITGDLTNMGSDEELLKVKSMIDSIQFPCYVLPGNHETNWSETGGASYKKLFGDDRFFFEKGNYRFVGFNTGPYMKMGDGYVKKEDLKWLNGILKNSKDNKYFISMAHYPLNKGLDNWPQVIELLKEHDVKFSLCGHGHRLKMLNFNGLTGLMGRSLLGRKNNDVAYNIITLKGDSVWVSQKKLKEKPIIKMAWNINNSEQIDSLKSPSIPSYQINQSYPNVKTEVLYEDESSILGGIAYSSQGYISWLSSQGTLKVMNASTKKVLWKKELGNPQCSTPIFINQFLIAGTSQGYLKAFNSADGELVWKTKVDYPVLGEGLSEDVFLYIGCGKGGMYKIDTRTGKIVWRFGELNGFVQAKPCITNRDLIFGAWDKYLYCVDKELGTLKWKWSNGRSAMLYSPGNVVPVVSDNKVFIVAPDRYFTVLDINNGKQLFRSNKHKVRESCGFLSDGELFMAKLMNDSVVGYSTSDPEFKEQWVIDVGFGYEHNPCPLIESNGIIYGGTKGGEIFAIDVNKQSLKWRHKIANSSINKLLIDNKRRLVVNAMDGKIVRF